MEAYENSNWWKYLPEPMRDLARESSALLEQPGTYHDYSFVGIDFRILFSSSRL